MTDKRKSLDEFAAENAPEDPEIVRLEREVMRLRRDRDLAKASHRVAEREVESMKEDLASLTALDGLNVESVKWSKSAKSNKDRHAATALIMLSDLHLDEVVNPAEVSGMNAYSREIALMRLQRTAEGAVRMGTDLMSGFSYEGAIVVLGGDLVSGDLHDLNQFNESVSVIGTVDYWVDHLAEFLSTIGDAYGSVHVVSVVGNHGRNTRKPRTKGRVEDNFDHMIARMLQRHFRADERFSWNIPLSADAYVDVYDTRLLITHGDQAKGGSGISGLLTPVSLLDHRKRKRDATLGRSFSHMFLGHFHTYLRTGTVTVNGSMKGTDEFSFLMNFGHEEPSQAFAVITPEHGVTIESAIYSMDRKKEGW
ncbi:hypothetical protein UFOVP1305_32 [uncultured Caudovirales phage]|uniref:Calcineurin-like phosphoesterase domain-containing protein n=1 Tax=uncultured Caudovirales phage TaxID=2100421 RepID=A0A6J5PCP3_9CAUD|nr:hypothetical protein UFOVP896_70 [uncultured Caudovirales phage]CAB4197766.1 hypothetical protein UFOVP1305_32 [uncultured Caudovirales phage]